MWTKTIPAQCLPQHNIATEPPHCKDQAFTPGGHHTWIIIHLSSLWRMTQLARLLFPPHLYTSSCGCAPTSKSPSVYVMANIISLYMLLSVDCFCWKSDHILHWHSQLLVQLLFCFPLHVTLLHKLYVHLMCTTDSSPDVFSIDLNTDVILVIVLLKHLLIEQSLCLKLLPSMPSSKSNK